MDQQQRIAEALFIATAKDIVEAMSQPEEAITSNYVEQLRLIKQNDQILRLKLLAMSSIKAAKIFTNQELL